MATAKDQVDEALDADDRGAERIKEVWIGADHWNGFLEDAGLAGQEGSSDEYAYRGRKVRSSVDPDGIKTVTE
ncbi:Hypothetical predicted protein [Olea europaea subsp. europaea]|uniref:Uncharacterized protein n=1 Tax=Olea europaea subsp. europaea TaxID=158383 RepID=A0A8S0QAY4_OLEEU|nr:Hypothetical predicted protein [Olea europaea subsp. europaea]